MGKAVIFFALPFLDCSNQAPGTEQAIRLSAQFGTESDQAVA
jgi:hypothetical protein